MSETRLKKVQHQNQARQAVKAEKPLPLTDQQLKQWAEEETHRKSEKDKERRKRKRMGRTFVEKETYRQQHAEAEAAGIRNMSFKEQQPHRQQPARSGSS